MYKKFRNLIFYSIIFTFLFSVNKVYSATLSIIPTNSTVSIGNIISLKVFVNTEGKSINNTEVKIEFPTDMIEVVSVTKSSSIFSLWVEEPSFSNSTGKITFNGGVPNPGYNGSNGYIATITFKAKKQGTASVIFTDGAVRENDGLGTDILISKNGSVIQIGIPQVLPIPVPITETEKSTVPAKPVILSDTHPDQDLWYSIDTATFSWKIPSGVTSLQTLFNKNPNATPSITYDNSVSQKTLNNLSDGTSYFHLRYINSTGSGAIAHYKVNIDTTPPLDFSPTVRIVDNKSFIKLEAKDITSGIDYYQIGIDELPLIKVTQDKLIKNEYSLPSLNGGVHNIIVTAYDKAGNYRESKLTFSSPDIISPTISLNSNEIKNGDFVIVSGKTNYPGEQVVVVFESEGKELNRYTQKVSSDGTFSITTDAIKTKGLISIWAEVILSDEVKSAPSEKVFLKVNETEVVRVTLAIFYPLIGLILIITLLLVMIFLLYLGWHKFFGLKKKINNDLEQTTKEVHKAMLLLKEELSSQLESLEKVKQDRALNKKEEIIFEEIQKNVDSIDDFVKNKLRKII